MVDLIEIPVNYCAVRTCIVRVKNNGNLCPDHQQDMERVKKDGTFNRWYLDNVDPDPDHIWELPRREKESPVHTPRCGKCQCRVESAVVERDIFSNKYIVEARCHGEEETVEFGTDDVEPPVREMIMFAVDDGRKAGGGP